MAGEHVFVGRYAEDEGRGERERRGGGGGDRDSGRVETTSDGASGLVGEGED